MLFSLSCLLSAFAVVISVSAVSLPDPSTPSAGSGAAYFMTNDPDGNQILAMNIASNGTLSGITATSTGGRGGCSCIPIVAPGPLDSSGSIKTNAVKKILVAVNPGSNTLSMFKIDLYNPAQLTMVGDPVNSGGDIPVSVAINGQGTMVCVLNAGPINGVNCYKPDLKLGLIVISNTLRSLGLVPTTPLNFLGSPSQVVFSEDGETLIAAVKGDSLTTTPGFLATWAIAGDGSLSAESIKSTAPRGGLNPFSTTLIPGKNAVLVADTAVGFDIFDFGTQNSRSANSSAISIPGQQATCWSSLSSKSGNFFLTDPTASIVTEVKVDNKLQGTIVRQYPQTANSATNDNDIASIGPDDSKSDFLYILVPNFLAVYVLDVSTPGKAMTVQNFNFTSAAEKVGVTPNPNYLVGMTTFVN